MGRQETTSSLMGDYGDCVCSKKNQYESYWKVTYSSRSVCAIFKTRSLTDPFESTPHPCGISVPFKRHSSSWNKIRGKMNWDSVHYTPWKKLIITSNADALTLRFVPSFYFSTCQSVHLPICPPVYLCVRLSNCPSVCLSTFYLSVYPYVSLSICLSICQSVHLSVHMSVCPSVCLSICQSVHLSVCPSVCICFRLSNYLSVFLSICPSTYLSVRVSFCLFVRRPVCLSVCLCACLSIFVCLTIWLSVYLLVCLSFYLPVCLPVHLSIGLSVCLSACLSVILPVCLSVFLSVHLFSHLYLAICHCWHGHVQEETVPILPWGSNWQRVCSNGWL